MRLCGPPCLQIVTAKNRGDLHVPVALHKKFEIEA